MQSWLSVRVMKHHERPQRRARCALQIGVSKEQQSGHSPLSAYARLPVAASGRFVAGCVLGM